MGISNVMAHLLERLHQRGAFAGKRSILELGPQDLVVSRPVLANFATSVSGVAYSVADVEAKFFEGGNARWWTATRDFYALLGLGDYHAADIDDERSEYTIDLNNPIRLGRRFDVITNFGTTEHVFNIGNAFKAIHDHLEVGGVALHVLPTRGDYNHGFFNIHSTFYRDLARANAYEIVDLVSIPDFGGQHDFIAVNEAVGEQGPRQSIMVDAVPGSERSREEAFAKQVLERRTSGMRVFDYVFAALRKTIDAPFLNPQQTIRLEDDPNGAPVNDRPDLARRSEKECRLVAAIGPALAYLHAQRWADAEASARTALEIDPQSVDARRILDAVQWHTKGIVEAVPVLTRACEQDPTNVEAVKNLGLVLQALKRRDEALRCFRRATTLAPSLTDIDFQMATILREKGDLAQAMKIYRRVLALDPAYADAVVRALAAPSPAA